MGLVRHYACLTHHDSHGVTPTWRLVCEEHVVAAFLLLLAAAHPHLHLEGLFDEISKRKLGGLHKDSIGCRLQGRETIALIPTRGHDTNTLALKHVLGLLHCIQWSDHS